MREGKTKSMPGIGLRMKGKMGTGIEIKYKADNIAYRIGNGIMIPLHKDKIYAILDKCGDNSNDAKSDNLAEFPLLIIV